MNNNKIDSYSEHINNSIGLKMKPIYGTNDELNCGTIKYEEKLYLLEHKDKDNIINFDKSFVFNNYENEDYPSYASNYKRFTYLDFIFNFNKETSYYHFKNGNKYDLRRCNVEIYHYYHKNIIKNYDIIEYINGHYNNTGHDANIMKNPLWKIKENNTEYLLMYCEKDTICKICPESYKKIIEFEITNGKKLTWYKHSNGYIVAHISSENKLLYIHQVIMNCYGNGKGTKNISIDHIDQNPLNNCLENLRIATRKEQEQNTKGIKEGTKRDRKNNAKNLPEGITQDMMKKYVVYYHEWLDKEHTKEREFFKVEKHPKLDKPWMTSKSNKISIQEKLKQANKVVEDLENDIYPEKEENQLPNYVSIITTRGKQHLVFDKIHKEKRITLKMVLPEEYDINEQMNIFKIKVREKYGACLINNENIFNYIYDTKIDILNKYVNKITFDISRFHKVKHTLTFEDKKTEMEAIIEAEKFLSKKLTNEYFDTIKEDCLEPYEFYKNLNCNRGQVLGSAIYIEFIEKFDKNHIYLSCGS
jgi:hypothetical protein